MNGVLDSHDDGPVLTVVVPVFNEEQALPLAREQLNTLLRSFGRTFEVLVTDNGSTDGTEKIMQDISRQDPQWKYVRLSRNFGYQNSITAGMTLARGQAIVVIDVDLQDPPEMIADFLKHWDEGYEIVYGVRSRRTGEPAWRIAVTMWAMRAIRWLSDHPMPAHSGDFRLISRRVRDAFIQLPESNRYVRGMIHWLGFKQLGIPYVRRGRQFGQEGRLVGGTGFIAGLVSVMANAVFGFSLKPLRLFSAFGLIVLAFTMCLVPVQIVLLLMGKPAPPGFMTLLFLLLLNLSVISLSAGLLGEYLGRTYAEVKRRPLWLVDYTLNLADNQKPSPAPPTQPGGSTQPPV
ncbi:MAG TPA: glycosyltransferase family 2 protein [Candidatus Saccharimonadia bacterium]|nr:glycosyltransferase family 2 protein [Candidatus Saccharimonadia bacterium]